MKSIKYKWITGGLELMFAIPTLSMLLVKDTFYIPIIIMFSFHAFTFVTSMSEKNKAWGSLLGIYTTIASLFYSLGWILHFITAVLLLVDANMMQKKNKENWEKELKKNLVEKQILEKINPILIYDDAGYDICLDTDILLDYDDELVYLYEHYGIKFYISRAVYNEISEARYGDDEEIVASAHKAFSLLETYQMNDLLEILNVPDEEEIAALELGDTIIDTIIATYKKEVTKGRPLAFLSSDKGARILARQTEITTIDYAEQADKTYITEEEMDEEMGEMEEKNVLISILLTFIGGPLGLFYSSIPIAIALLVISLLLLKLGVYGAMIAWMINIVAGVHTTMHYNTALQNSILGQDEEPIEPAGKKRKKEAA